MSEKSTRDYIVEAADRLFYRNGYEHTSFAAIADAVNISRGNFYYYFKTKDEILDAVIAVRLAATRGMLDTWERNASTPVERIRSFVHILITNRADIKQFGCPVGTLNLELVKLGHDARSDASSLFTLFRTWLRRQFTLLGCKDDADILAMHVLAMSQGVATLAATFHDDKFIDREVQRMDDWLAELTGAATSKGRPPTN